MLRLILILLFLSSCSLGTIKKGGEDAYLYDTKSEYTSENLKELSHKVVLTSERDPHVGKLKDLFGPKQPPLKRVGIVVFESEVQPTREGLAGKNLIYMNEAGKQIMTENFLSIWEQSMKLLSPDVDFVPMSKIKKSKAFNLYGLAEDDFVKAKRSTLAPDDIFFLESGKKTTVISVVNPRGSRDMAFLLVPAYELMGGPKWSEHNKQFINDLAKELNLDAVIIVMSQTSWTAAHTDKHSGEFIPEEIKIKVKASTLVPLVRYHERLKKIGMKETPNLTICYRAYESELKIPALISVPEEMKNFDTIQKEVLTPMMKAYKDLSVMTLMNLTEDLKRTW